MKEKSIDLKYGRFIFDEKGEDYPLGTWEIGGELGTEHLAVNPVWAKEHPMDALALCLNDHYLPIDAGLPTKVSGKFGDFNVYKFIDHNEELFYVGQTKDMYGRMRSHMAQKYIGNVEYALWTECDTEMAMDTLETILITGYRPPLNESMKQFGDPSMEREASRLDERYDWNFVWGVGSVFRDTKKICDDIKKQMNPNTLGLAQKKLAFVLKKANDGMDLDEAFDLYDKVKFRDAALQMRNGPLWSPSLAFQFDPGEYMKFVDDMEEYLVNNLGSEKDKLNLANRRSAKQKFKKAMQDVDLDDGIEAEDLEDGFEL